MLGRLAVATPLGSAAVAGIVSDLRAAAHPDAELLAFGTELAAVTKRMGQQGLSLEESETLGRRAHELEDQIAALPAKTAAGLAVKLRLAWDFVVVDGHVHEHGPQPNSDFVTRLLWQLISEAEAIGAAAG
jgi:hypothetical protein